jgi:hypothetical protein
MASAAGSPVQASGHPPVRLQRGRQVAAEHGGVAEGLQRGRGGRPIYGWSILHCLPATLAEDPVEATGTVLRAPTVERWAAAAGFTGFEVLAIDNPFWRFYRLWR